MRITKLGHKTPVWERRIGISLPWNTRKTASRPSTAFPWEMCAALFAILLFLSSTPFANAQTPLQLSLKRSVEIALAPEGSERVALANVSLAQAESKVAQARNAFLPILSASIQDRSQTVNLGTAGIDIKIPGFLFPSLVGPFQVFDARVAATAPVLDFGIIRKLRAARSGQTASKFDLETTRNQVAERVSRAYLGALRAAAALEAARANVQLGEALANLAESLRNAGTGTGIEVTRARVQLANDRQKSIVAENNRRRANLELLRTMGINLNIEIVLIDKLVFAPVNVAAAELELSKARAERTELKGQKQHEETARLNYSAVRGESLPSVAAFGNYGGIGHSMPDAQATHTVGVTLEVPILDSRRNGRRDDSYLQYRAEKVRTRDMEQQIELEVRLSLDALKSAQSQVETAREGLGLADNEMAQARRRYEAGVTNSIEVTDAQTRLDRSRDNWIAALYSYSLARIDLAAATGRIAEYVNPSGN